MPSATHELLWIEEVAELCRAPVGTVRHWMRTGRLPSLRLGRRRLVRREDLDALLASARTPAVDVGARGLTNRGGNPGRLTPTADSNVDGGAAASPTSKGGVDRPGVAGGEERSTEGAQPTSPSLGPADSGEQARSGGVS